MTDDPSNEMPR